MMVSRSADPLQRDYVTMADCVCFLTIGLMNSHSIALWATVDRGGVEELIEAIRSDQATPAAGVEEASRTLRKKLKYGDSRMQIRSLAVLKGLSQRGPQVWRDRWADGLMMARLKEMARDVSSPRTRNRGSCGNERERHMCVPY